MLNYEPENKIHLENEKLFFKLLINEMYFNRIKFQLKLFLENLRKIIKSSFLKKNTAL